MGIVSRNAIKISIVLLLAVIVFHVCIILKIVPYNIAWGGRLTNDYEMYLFETISIFINAFLIIVLLMKGDLIAYKFPHKVVNIILWLFFVIFVINTIGNTFAKTSFEKYFAFLTGLLAILTWNVIHTTKIPGR